MKRLSMVLLGLAAGCATVQAPLYREDEGAFYEETVERMAGRGAPIDLAHLDYLRLRRAASLMADAGQTKTARAQLARVHTGGVPLAAAAGQLLAADFTDVQGHLERARALHQLDPRMAALHETVALGLLTSILDTGDTEGRPFRVFASPEEDAVIAFLDLRADSRHEEQWGGRLIDAVTCSDRRGRSTVLRFDRTPPVFTARR
jgi:hypothetical protein